MRVKIKSILICCFVGALSYTNLCAQDQDKKISIEDAEWFLKEEPVAEKWLLDLQTPGVKVDGDKMIFSDEALKLINDTEYRNAVYKNTPYTFIDVRNSLGQSEIQKAFWQLLDLYPENKEQVLKYIYAYDSTIPSDKVLTSAFYTYAFFDPKITTIENGKPSVNRPDVFEEYFRRTKEIVSYIQYFRKQKS